MAGVCVFNPIDAEDFKRRRKLRQVVNPTRSEREQMCELDRRLGHSMHKHVSLGEACEMACEHSPGEKRAARHDKSCSKPSAGSVFVNLVARWLTPLCIALRAEKLHGRRKKGIPGESALPRRIELRVDSKNDRVRHVYEYAKTEFDRD